VDTENRPAKAEAQAQAGPARATTPQTATTARANRYVVDRLLDLVAGLDADTRRYLLRSQGEYADDLAGPTPAPIERALADVAATCWLTLRIFEVQYWALEKREAVGLAEIECRQQLVDRAHRRLLQTLRALALVRRAAPSVRVTIAGNQVNVAAGAGRPAERAMTRENVSSSATAPTALAGRSSVRA
jgi:hypothetical protein